jgi:hypothetical protein
MVAVYLDKRLIAETGVDGSPWAITKFKPSDGGWWTNPLYKARWEDGWRTGVKENCPQRGSWGGLFDTFKKLAPGSQAMSVWLPDCTNGGDTSNPTTLYMRFAFNL